jgi:hypothetical protein
LRIKSLKQYQRSSNRARFDDLPLSLRCVAEGWLAKWERRRAAKHGRVPAWLHAIYCGQAKSVALHPRDGAWGRWMRAKRGGYAVQRKYRAEGRNPTAKATAMATYLRRARKRQLRVTPTSTTVSVATSTAQIPQRPLAPPGRYRRASSAWQATRALGVPEATFPVGSDAVRAPFTEHPVRQRAIDESAISQRGQGA